MYNEVDYCQYLQELKQALNQESQDLVLNIKTIVKNSKDKIKFFDAPSNKNNTDVDSLSLLDSEKNKVLTSLIKNILQHFSLKEIALILKTKANAFLFYSDILAFLYLYESFNSYVKKDDDLNSNDSSSLKSVVRDCVVYSNSILYDVPLFCANVDHWLFVFNYLIEQDESSFFPTVHNIIQEMNGDYYFDFDDLSQTSFLSNFLLAIHTLDPNVIKNWLKQDKLNYFFTVIYSARALFEKIPEIINPKIVDTLFQDNTLKRSHLLYLKSLNSLLLTGAVQLNNNDKEKIKERLNSAIIPFIETNKKEILREVYAKSFILCFLMLSNKNLIDDKVLNCLLEWVKKYNILSVLYRRYYSYLDTFELNLSADFITKVKPKYLVYILKCCLDYFDMKNKFFLNVSDTELKKVKNKLRQINNDKKYSSSFKDYLERILYFRQPKNLITRLSKMLGKLPISDANYYKNTLIEIFNSHLSIEEKADLVDFISLHCFSSSYNYRHTKLANYRNIELFIAKFIGDEISYEKEKTYLANLIHELFYAEDSPATDKTSFVDKIDFIYKTNSQLALFI